MMEEDKCEADEQNGSFEMIIDDNVNDSKGKARGFKSKSKPLLVTCTSNHVAL